MHPGSGPLERGNFNRNVIGPGGSAKPLRWCSILPGNRMLHSIQGEAIILYIWFKYELLCLFVYGRKRALILDIWRGTRVLRIVVPQGSEDFVNVQNHCIAGCFYMSMPPKSNNVYLLIIEFAIPPAFWDCEFAKTASANVL